MAAVVTRYPDRVNFAFDDAPEVAAVARAVPRPFELRLEESVAAVQYPYFMRGPMHVQASPVDPIVLTGTSATLCAQISLADNVVTLTLTPVTVLPETSAFYTVPLYILSRPDEDSDWQIDVDLRPGMIIVYV